MVSNNEFLLKVVTDIEERLLKIFNDINIKEQIEVALRECGKFGLNSNSKDILKFIEDLTLSDEGREVFSEYQETAQEEGSPEAADDKSTDQPDRPLTQATQDLEPTAARTGRAPDSAALAAEEQAALAAEEQAKLAAWLEGRAAEDLYLIESQQALEVLESISTSRGSVSAVQERELKTRIADANKIKNTTKELQVEIDKMKTELDMNDDDLEELYKASDQSTVLDGLRKDKTVYINLLKNYPTLSEIMDLNQENNEKLALLDTDDRVNLLKNIAVTNHDEKSTKKDMISIIHSDRKVRQSAGGGKKKRTYKKKKKRRSKKKRTPMKRKKTPMKKKTPI